MEDLVDAEDPVEPLDELALAEFDREFAEEVADLEEVEHPGAPSGAEAPAQRRPIEVFTRQELYEEAKELDIPGRSRMTKQQLFDAIEEATA
nr:Rho termination factor N-terminal domain-containing protein [Rothia sp. P100]